MLWQQNMLKNKYFFALQWAESVLLYQSMISASTQVVDTPTSP